MSFQALIQNKISKSASGNGRSEFSKLCFILAKELGWGYEMLDYPLPFVLSILDELHDYNVSQQRAQKRK